MSPTRLLPLFWCACFSSIAAAQGFDRPSSADIAWRADYEAAMKEAAAQKKPLFIAFVMDNEVANDEVLAQHFHQVEIIKASEEFVCLLANMSRYPGVEMRARMAFMDSPRVAAPQFLFVRPDGETIVLRHVWMLSASELLKKMKTAIGLLDAAKAGDAEKQQQKLVDEWMLQAAGNNLPKRTAALRQLADVDDPRVVDFFVRQTAESVDEMKRLEAIDAMVARSSNGAILPTLHKLLLSGSPRIKTRVAIALQKIGAPDSGPALAAALKKESKDRVKAAFLRALAVCDGITPAYRKTLIAAAKTAGQAEKTAALRGLADMPFDTETKGVLVAALKDSSNPVRAVAYYGVALSDDKSFLSAVEKAAATEKSIDLLEISKAAVAAMRGEGFDPGGVSGRLRPYLSDEDLR